MSTLTDLRDKAEAYRGTGPLGFCTDAQSSKTHVAIAISTPRHSLVVTVERAEYDGTKLLALFGFPQEPQPGDAFERAIEEKTNARPARR